VASSDDTNAFRFAHWPGRPVEAQHIPPVSAGRFLARGAWLEAEPGSATEVHPPQELFLGGLLKLDVANPDAVAAFVSENGSLRKWDWKTAAVALDVWSWRVEEWDAFYHEVRRARRSNPPAVTGGRYHPARDPRPILTMLEATEQLRLARDATRYYLAAMGKVDVDDALAASESAILRPPDPQEDTMSWEHGRVDLMAFEDISDRRRIWTARALESIVNFGLREFPMAIQVAGVEADQIAHIWRDGPTLFGFLCLQIADHIARGATLRQCKNTSCGRWFSRQSGRAEYNQHRTSGVIYCSASCARTQGSRAWRRRKRAEKAGSK
jgi:hypothetical protein